MDKVYKIGKKTNAHSDSSGGRVVKALVHETEGLPKNLEIFRERKKKKEKDRSKAQGFFFLSL